MEPFRAQRVYRHTRARSLLGSNFTLFNMHTRTHIHRKKRVEQTLNTLRKSPTIKYLAGLTPRQRGRTEVDGSTTPDSDSSNDRHFTFYPRRAVSLYPKTELIHPKLGDTLLNLCSRMAGSSCCVTCAGCGGGARSSLLPADGG